MNVVKNKNCKNFVKRQPSCDSSTESDRQEQCRESSSLYPVLSHSSIYYEENQLFNELDESVLSPVESVHKNSSSHLVEIREEFSTPIDLPPIYWHGYNSVPKIISATNTGRIILISGQWTHTKPYISGGPLNGSYIFSQIHFHSPSEHEIDGKRYPLEMHVVHYKTCYLTQERAMEEKDGTVVLVYLFQVNNSASQSALSFVSKLGSKITKVNSQAEITNVTLDQIVKPFTSNYYIYWGSVKAVKNSYVLQWVINCSSLYVSQQEMDDFLTIMGSNIFITEYPAPQMKPVNNAIFYVENYTMPDGTAEKVTTCNTCHAHSVRSTYHPTSKSCSVQKGLGTSQVHSHTLHAKESQIKKDVQLQTSSRDKTVTVKLTPTVYDDNPKQKVSTEATRTPVEYSCSSCEIESQTSVSEDCKKKKKKSTDSCKKVASSPSVSAATSDCSNKNGQEHVEDCEVKKPPSRLFVKICSSLGVGNEKEKDAAKRQEKALSNCQLTQKDEQKMESQSNESACDTSKSSICSGNKSTKSHRKGSSCHESSCESAKSSSHECQSRESRRSTQKSDLKSCECASENSKLSLSESKQKKKKAKKQKSDTDCAKSESGSSKSIICDDKKKEKKEKQKKGKKERKEKKEKKEKVKKKKSKTDISETTSASSCVILCCDEKVPEKEETKKTDECDSTIIVETLTKCEPEDQKKEKINETSFPPNNIQCMSALGSTVMVTETLNQFENKPSKETNEAEKLKIVKSNESTKSGKSGKLLTEIKLENVTKNSECGHDIKTIFEKKEKKREQSVSESSAKDYTVDFLLPPNDQKCPSALLATSESEGLGETNAENAIPSRCNVPEVTVNTAMVSGVILPTEKPKDSAKEFCLQTEHLFRSERKGDFSECASQEYNVAIIYNQNILQEFRGTFQPNKLELGSYEKLDLVPKYLDPDNVTVRLEDCIVKMETKDQLYIRAKFLLKKIDIEDMIAKYENDFYENAKKSDLMVLNNINKEKGDLFAKAITVEGLQLEDNIEKKKKIENELALINKKSVNEKCQVNTMKSRVTDLKQSSENVVIDSSEQSSEIKNEKTENNIKEKSGNDFDDKGVKNLINKHKKTVYFTYEKVQKDLNTGKKIFVGSFRTNDDIRVLNKEKKLQQSIKNFFSFEKFIENNEDKKFFLLPNKELDSEEVIKIENSIDRDDLNIKIPSKIKNTDKVNSSKDLITLHKYKPKNLVENSKSERKSLSVRDLDHTIKLDILLSKKSVKLQISEIDSSINKTQRYSPKMKCQTGVIVIPVELHSLSKIELVVIEHPKTNKENNGKRKKEYIPCLNGYF